jgi:hypothetical protein
MPAELSTVLCQLAHKCDLLHNCTRGCVHNSVAVTHCFDHQDSILYLACPCVTVSQAQEFSRAPASADRNVHTADPQHRVASVACKA